MKSVLFAKSKPKTPPPPAVGEDVPRFVKIGAANGHPVPDLMDRLAAFYAKYPESRQSPGKGEKSIVAKVTAARDRR